MMRGGEAYSLTELGAAWVAASKGWPIVEDTWDDPAALLAVSVTALHLAPADAARVLGVGPTRLRAMLTGAEPITADVWARLTRAVDAEAADLIAIAADLRALNGERP